MDLKEKKKIIDRKKLFLKIEEIEENKVKVELAKFLKKKQVHLDTISECEIIMKDGLDGELSLQKSLASTHYRYDLIQALRKKKENIEAEIIDIDIEIQRVQKKLSEIKGQIKVKEKDLSNHQNEYRKMYQKNSDQNIEENYRNQVIQKSMFENIK